MAIRIEVMEDGKIEIYDTESRRWLEFVEVRKALRVLSQKLHAQIDTLQKNYGIQQRS